MKKTALIYIVFASILWSTSGVFANYITPYGFSPLHLTLVRSIVPFFCMGIYMLLVNRKLFKVSIKELLLYLGSGLGFLGTASLYFYGMQLTSISTAVVLMYTAPVMVMIYSVTFLGEKLTKAKVFSVICMFVGCLFVSGIIGGMKFNIIGILIGLLSGVAFAGYNIFTKLQMKNGCNPIKANFYGFLFSFVAGIFISDPMKMAYCINANPMRTILLLIGMGVVTSILPYFFYSLSLRDIPAGTASSLAILEPMSATLLSVIIFEEELRFLPAMGIVLILGATLFLSRQKE